MKLKNNTADYVVKIRQKIHMHPEIGFKEYQTQSLIVSELTKAKLDIKTAPTKTGVIGILHGMGKGKPRHIAFRADMDALPIQEKNKVNYRSKIDGIMHACGHDAHTAMLLALAQELSRIRDKFSGTISFIFQPNEENGIGGQHMIDWGCFKDSKPSVIYGLHVFPDLPVGKIGIKYGPMMAADDRFRIVFTGVGGHAAIPEKVRDVIVAGAAFVQGIQTIVSRKVSPNDAAVVSIGKIEAGETYNIIPDKLEILGTIRSVCDSTRKKIRKYIKNMAKHYANAYNIDVNIVIEPTGNILNNNRLAVNRVKMIAKNILGARNVVLLETVCMGNEDFANYLQHVPGCFIYLGVRNKKKKIQHGWHHPEFDIDEMALPIGVELLKELAIQ